MSIISYTKTAKMMISGQTNGGLIYLVPQIATKLIYLIPLLFIWQVVMSGGRAVDVGMDTATMLSYTYVNALLLDMTAVSTAASAWNYEGLLITLFTRPMSVFGHLIAQTIGGWVPMLLMFSLPMAAISPLLGISVVPATMWFFPSLLLCISLGFAIDFLFACLAIKLRGVSWLITVIRWAIVSLLSGTVIPFKLMPFGLDKVFALQPFGSLGGAALSVFTGISDPLSVILIQLFWNAVLWPTAIIVFKKSQEGMMSYGG